MAKASFGVNYGTDRSSYGTICNQRSRLLRSSVEWLSALSDAIGVSSSFPETSPDSSFYPIIPVTATFDYVVYCHLVFSAIYVCSILFFI